jgi:hypothetical protein
VLRTLDIGEGITATILAAVRWNGTGVLVGPGECYSLVATGTWTDWKTVTDPNGYTSPNLWLRCTEGVRRLPKASWFRLAGSIGRQRTSFFAIGRTCTYEPTDRGELVCFANDIDWMYFNNSGQINLKINRVR